MTPGRPRQWSPWKWVRAMWVIWVLLTPARVICRWVPSPGSKRMPSSSHWRNRALWLRSRVGTWLAVPRKVTTRADIVHLLGSGQLHQPGAQTRPQGPHLLLQQAVGAEPEFAQPGQEPGLQQGGPADRADPRVVQAEFAQPG